MRSWGDQVVSIVRASTEHRPLEEGLGVPPTCARPTRAFRGRALREQKGLSGRSLSLFPLHIVGGQPGCLSGHQGLVESAVAERERPVIAGGGAVRRSIQASLGMEQVALPSGSEAYGGQQGPGSSESSQSVRPLPLVHLILRPPYNVFFLG